MKILFLIFTSILVSCGKGGGSDTSTEMISIQTSNEASEVHYGAKFLDEDLYYTLNTQGRLPQLTDSRYVDFNFSYLSEKEMNHQVFEKGLRHIKIVALDLNLGGEDSHDVYQHIKRTMDVKNLEIIARKVEISGPLHIAGGDVIIKAEKIIFKKDGKIITTPEKAPKRAANFQNGARGLDAGSITLLSQDLIWDKAYRAGKNFLITTGGEGQDAGAGEDGSDGRNINAVKAGAHIYQSERETCRRTPNNPRHKFISIPNSIDCRWIKDLGRASTNGEDAKQGGLAGIGGAAGVITLSIKVNEGIQNTSGKNGENDTLRRGGKAGLPQRVCKMRIDSKGKGAEFDCIETKNGKDIEPLIQEQIHQKSNIMLSQESFVTSTFLRKLSSFASDVYKANHIDYAKDIYTNIENALETFSNKDSATLATYNTVQTNLLKIASHKDYYGKEKTWIPNLGFEVNYKIFEKEMKSNLRNLYYARLLKRDILSIEKKKEIIKNLQEDLYSEIVENKGKITKFNNEAEAIKKTVKNIEVAEDKFKFELYKLEEEFYKTARNNLEISFFKKATRVLSAASKAIPVGQPTFAAVGVGLDILDMATNDDSNFFDIITEIESSSKEFEEFDWKGATSSLEKKISSLDPSVFVNANTKEKLRYLKDVRDFTNPIYKAISEQIKLLNSQEVSSTKLEAEIQKIKKGDSRFQNVIKILEKLLADKQGLIVQFENFNLGILSSLELIQENYLKISELNIESENTILFETTSLVSVLKEIENSAVERLGYYHYLFTKSYEYRFLKKYNKAFSHEALTVQMDRFFNLEDSFESQIEALFLFYKSELSSIAYNIVSEINDLGISHLMSAYINLSKEEEAALNSGEEIFIDLRNIYLEGKEDIRLDSIQLVEAEVFGSSDDYFELRIQHSGTSLIERSGKTFIFKHENTNWPNLTWLSYKGASMSQIQYSREDERDYSLFSEMFGIKEKTKILTQPGGKSFISLKLKKDKSSKLEQMKLKVDYSFKL